MAIATSHTVHIAILPPPDLLNAQHNQEPLKLKTYTIGPTTHVLSQSPVPCVLWHPLGEGGNCLVTITTDAVVRLWEFDVDNRWSADSPALALDLKKLLIAKSEEDDVKPYRGVRNTIYSADAVGMDVASASFGGAGYGDEAPWSAMTLWVAMTSGDIYALCPLLPSRFQPPTNLLPSLLPAIMERQASRTEEDGHQAPYEDQIRWANDLDDQEPFIKAVDDASDPEIEIYKRPTKGGSNPILQGPFQLFPEDAENDLEISDIHVIASKSTEADDADETSSGSGTPFERRDEEGLSSTLVCILTREGRVYVCIDLDGVEGKWLPSKPQDPSSTFHEDPLLVVLEGLDTLKAGEDCPTEWPTFTEDTESRYSFFITHGRGVYYMSCSPWLDSFERELQNDDSAGVQFRLNMFKNNIATTRERILSFPQPDDSDDTDLTIPACVLMEDSDLGYFLLTTHGSHPQAATLDRPYLPPVPHTGRDLTPIDEDITPIDSLTPSIAYPPYQPSSAFYTTSALPTFTSTHVPARHRHLLKSEVRLSTATLDIMTEAHRVLSRETHQLGVAAADLFRRCDSLLEVLKNQVVRAGGVAERVDAVTGAGAGEEAGSDAQSDGGKGRRGRTRDVLEERIQRAQERQGHLRGRIEEVRRKARGLESKELSAKEEEWAREVEGVAKTVLGRKTGDGDEEDEDERREEEDAVHLSRFQAVCCRVLVSHALSLCTLIMSRSNDSRSPSSRKQKNSLPTTAQKTRHRNATRTTVLMRMMYHLAYASGN